RCSCDGSCQSPATSYQLKVTNCVGFLTKNCLCLAFICKSRGGYTGLPLLKENFMTQVDTSVFRKYDIRGTVSGDNVQITPDLARLVGKALGTYMPMEFQTERMFVGCDNRPSSAGMKQALMEGVASTG